MNKIFIVFILLFLSVSSVMGREQELVNITDCASDLTITLVNHTLDVVPGEYSLTPCNESAPNVWNCECNKIMLVTNLNTVNNYTFNISARIYNLTQDVTNYSENTTLTTEHSQIVIDEDSSKLNSTITISENVTEAKLNMSSLLIDNVTDNTTKLTMIGHIDANINTSKGIIGIEFPSNLTITGSDLWDGQIILPQLILNNNTNVTADSGYDLKSTDLVINIGQPNINLTFDKAVKITLPGMNGKSAGFQKGEIFTPIKTKCNNVNDYRNIVGNGECYISSGNDLLIWTKHFTEFIAYTQQQQCTGCACTNSCSSGGSSGGSSSHGGVILNWTKTNTTSLTNQSNTTINITEIIIPNPIENITTNETIVNNTEVIYNQTIVPAETTKDIGFFEKIWNWIKRIFGGE